MALKLIGVILASLAVGWGACPVSVLNTVTARQIYLEKPLELDEEVEQFRGTITFVPPGGDWEVPSQSRVTLVEVQSFGARNWEVMYDALSAVADDERVPYCKLRGNRADSRSRKEITAGFSITAMKSAKLPDFFGHNTKLRFTIQGMCRCSDDRKVYLLRTRIAPGLLSNRKP